MSCHQRLLLLPGTAPGQINTERVRALDLEGFRSTLGNVGRLIEPGIQRINGIRVRGTSVDVGVVPGALLMLAVVVDLRPGLAVSSER